MGSTWNERPTPTQIRAIVRLCRILRIREPLEERCGNRHEARDTVYLLNNQIKGVAWK